MMNYLRFFLYFNLSLFVATVASGQDLSPQAAELEKLPPALKESLTEYLLKGTNQAIINLKNYWLPTRDRDEFSRNIRERIRDLDRYFGDPRKVESIFERQLTDSIRSYYLAIGYEEGVIFARFDVYSVDEKAWVIHYALDSKIDAVLPSYIDPIR